MYLCSFSAMLCAIVQNRSVPGLDFAVPWAGCIRSVCHSHHLCLGISLRGAQVLQLLGAFSFSLLPEPLWLLFHWDWTISTLPISAPCHWETDHLGGTGGSSKWWEGVNWLYFYLNFLFPLLSTRLSVIFCSRCWENIVAGFCSDLLVQSFVSVLRYWSDKLRSELLVSSEY